MAIDENIESGERKEKETYLEDEGVFYNHCTAGFCSCRCRLSLLVLYVVSSRMGDVKPYTQRQDVKPSHKVFCVLALALPLLVIFIPLHELAQ